jgi:hypothetical protein
MTRSEELRNVFRDTLIAGLITRYNKLPSAAFVAKEFNLRARDTEPITQESARRWLRGKAIPEISKLFILQLWLNIDLNSLNIYLTEALQYKNKVLDISPLPDQEYFIKKTDSLKKSLLALMEDLGDLEEKILKIKNK